jgi:hypothetical protein
MNDDFDFFFGGALMFAFLFFAAALVIGILFLISLQKALDAVSPDSRQMPSGQVWLLLIPLFNLGWLFYVVAKIGDSFRNEYARLDLPSREERPSYGIGLAYAVLSVCSILPLIGGLAGLAGFVCWIIYWVKVNECRKEIQANQNNNLLEAERGIFHQ